MPIIAAAEAVEADEAPVVEDVVDNSRRDGRRDGMTTTSPPTGPQTPSSTPSSSHLRRVRVYDPLELAIEKNNSLCRRTAPYLRTRATLNQWVPSSTTLAQVLRRGLKLPLTKIPLPSENTWKTTPEELKAVMELLEKGIIRKLTPAEVARTKTWVRHFARRKPSGALRIISDLRPLNSCLEPTKFRYPNIRDLQRMIADESNCWAIKVDVTDFFHHVGLDESAARWCRFKVCDDRGDVTAFQYTCLPFGLRLSPFWANSLAKEAMAEARTAGAVFHWYVDDVLIFGRTPGDTVHNAASVVNSMTRRGLALNLKKSELVPTKKLEYLGYEIDLKTRSLSTAPQKKEQLLRHVDMLLKQKNLSAKKIHSLTGALQYQVQANAALRGLPAQTARINARLAASHGWKRHFIVPSNIRRNLHEIRSVIERPHPVRLLSPKMLKRATKIWSDASTTGWGAFIQTPDSSPLALSGRWSLDDGRRHSTHLEVAALAEAVLAAEQVLPRGAAVTLHSDCTTAVQAFNKGSAIARLNRLMSLRGRSFNGCSCAQRRSSRRGRSTRRTSRAGCTIRAARR